MSVVCLFKSHTDLASFEEIVLYHQVVSTCSIHGSKYPQGRGCFGVEFKVVQRLISFHNSITYLAPLANVRQ